jgi:hypothetical protein
MYLPSKYHGYWLNPGRCASFGKWLFWRASFHGGTVHYVRICGFLFCNQSRS